MKVTLHLGDCLDILPTLEAGSVDAVVTDPPYKTTDLHFDLGDANNSWIKSLLEVTQANGYLALFGSLELQSLANSLWNIRFGTAWIKPRGTMRSHNAKMPMNQWEPCYVYAHPNHTIAGLTWNKIKIDGEPYSKVQHNTGRRRGWSDSLDRATTSTWTKEGFVSENSGFRWQTDVINGPFKACMPFAERTEHPTQKPENVIMTIIRWLTNPGDLVLDPFMGSGTTGVACVKTGRNFIGIEIDPAYFAIAERRIAEAQQQLQLPLEAI